MTDVSVIGLENYDMQKCREALESALAPLGGLDFIKKGDKVVIKVNLVSPMKPEKAATTHPNLVCALCDMLAELGAVTVVGDSPGGLFTGAYLDRVYSACGMKDVENHSARLNDNFETTEAEFPSAVTAKKFIYTSYLKDADWIINFCKLKAHGMMGMTAGVKNMFGAVPGLVKPEYHYRFPKETDFASMIVDLNEYFKPALTICDAVMCMEGNGPTSGTPTKVGCIVASKSPYKLDLLCASLIGYEKDDVLTLAESYRRGFIPEKAEKLVIFGNSGEFIKTDFKKITNNRAFAFMSDSKSFVGRLAGKSIRKALSGKPDVTVSECIGCAKCADICPAKAINIQNGIPKINRKKCIRCFCCQEFCPRGAMKVKRNPIAKLFT